MADIKGFAINGERMTNEGGSDSGTLKFVEEIDIPSTSPYLENVIYKFGIYEWNGKYFLRIYNQYLMFYIPDGNTYVEKLSSEITNKLKKYIPSNDNIPIAVYADHLESADGFDMTGNYDPETEEFTIDDEYRSNRFFNFWLYEYNLGQYDQCFRNITLSPTALTCETNWKYETNGWVEIPFESLILIPVNWMGLIPLFVE